MKPSINSIVGELGSVAISDLCNTFNVSKAGLVRVITGIISGANKMSEIRRDRALRRVQVDTLGCRLSDKAVIAQLG